MRVLHAAETIQGGIATVLRQLLAAQTAHGMRQVCLVPDSQRSEIPNRIGMMAFRRSGRDLHSFMSFTICLAVIVWRFNPDVVHLHSTFAGCFGRLVLLLLRPFRQPKVIYCPHGWSFLMKGEGAREYLYALVERLLAGLSDRIICVSRYEAGEAAVHGLPERLIEVVLNGVEPPNDRMQPNPFEAGRINLLYVGRFDYQKGFDLLEHAMALLEKAGPFHLTAIGAPVLSGSMPHDRSNITYTGWLKPHDMAGYLRHADLLVMPSRWEAFGLVAAEAQSYGLPVVASDCCSLPEIVTEHVTGRFFRSGCSKSLAELIGSMGAADWHAMRDAAYRSYADNFCSERMCREVSAVYLRALEGARTGRRDFLPGRYQSAQRNRNGMRGSEGIQAPE